MKKEAKWIYGFVIDVVADEAAQITDVTLWMFVDKITQRLVVGEQALAPTLRLVQDGRFRRTPGNQRPKLTTDRPTPCSPPDVA